MTVRIATPCMTGEVTVGYTKSIIETFILLANEGFQVEHDVMIGCSNICVARNVMLADFLDSQADTLFFIDSDLSWKASDAVRVIGSPHDVIGGVYPAKNDEVHFLAKWSSRPTKLLVAEGLPGGFLKVSRKAILKMCNQFPQLRARYKHKRDIVALFDNGIFDGEYLGEDFAFTKRWQACGGTAYIDPDITFEHYGHKAWSGNLNDYLQLNRSGHARSA